MRAQARLQSAGFTALELTFVVVIIGVLGMFAATGLTSRVPEMQLRAQATVLMETLASARESALMSKMTQKVRIHQTRQAASIGELFKEDDSAVHGTHQIIFAAPVVIWFRLAPLPTTVLPTSVFPDLLKGLRYYDAGLPSTLNVLPMLRVWDLSGPPPLRLVFPKAIGGQRLSRAIELVAGIRIVAINNRPTYSAPGSVGYAVNPWRDPIPSQPVSPIGSPPRPSSSPSPGDDDRIADVTYSPDGVFSCAPQPATSSADFTIVFATEAGASALAPPGAITLTIDRRTGYPHF